MKGVGDRRAGIELDDVKINEHVYEDLDRKKVNINTHDNVQTREKTKLNDTSQLKMDKIKAVVGLLCVGMVVLVAALVTAICLVVFAVTDGGWTNWENWGACSVTCGTGFTTRIRTCSNPRPSIMGRYCDGTSMQVLSCNNRSCSDSAIGFSVFDPEQDFNGDSLIFQKAAYNDGNVYNMTSGMFVCKQEGLYFFINTMLKLGSETAFATCSFCKNGLRSSYVAGFAHDAQLDTAASGTNSIMFHLKPGDRVYLCSCSGIYDIMDVSSSFTGFLVSPTV